MEKALKKYSPIFVLPTLLAFTIGFIVPFFEGLYLSFCQFTTVKNAKWVGISNYQRVFADEAFLHSFGFTVKYAVVAIILINVIALCLALLLTRNIKGTNIFRTVFFMPNLIGGIVLGYIWQILINCILSLVGQPLLALNSQAGYWGIIVLTAWQQIGYMMIIYIAGLQNVPDDLIEAAQIDGASRFKIMLHIDIPTILPTIVIMLILRSGHILSVGYEKALLMQNDANIKYSQLISTYVYNEGLMKGFKQYSSATAINLFNSIINFICIWSVNQFSKKVGESSLW